MSEAAVQQSVMAGDDREFLSFVLGEEHYALDITTVKEIRGYEQVTKIANAPDFIKGVMNLRGDIVPVVDLRIMLNVDERIVGIVVDGVSDVIRLSEEEMLPPPEFGVAFDSRYLHGLADVDETMVILVNIESLINSNELGLVEVSQASVGE